MHTAIKLSKTQRIIKNSLITLCVLLGILSILCAWRYASTKRLINIQAKDLAIQKTKETAKKIAQEIQQLNLSLDSEKNVKKSLLEKIINSSFPSRWGYVSIIATDGTYIAHPIAEYVEQKKKAPDVARQRNDKTLALNIEKSIKGELNFFNYKNLVTGQPSWMIFESIPSTNWFAAGTFIVEEMALDTLASERQFILLIFSLVAFLTILFLLSIKVYICTPTKIGIACSSITIGIIIMIISLWYKEYNEVGKKTDHIIEKNVNFQQLIQKFYPSDSSIKSVRSSNAIMRYVGIYIHKISVDIDTISFVGYVWQKYPVTTQTVPEQILFPQATECVMEQAYTITEGDWKTIGWSIRCTLRQNFNYTSYPFDYQKIKIQIWPTTFDNEVALVPDLDSYKTVNPSALPGVNSEIVLQNWTLDRSYFSFEQEKYLTNFGYHSADNYTIIGRPTQKKFPELVFYIVSDRYALSTLILLLLPILIILMLLFIVIMMAARLRFHHMLASIASLFFSYLLAYIAFKASLPIQKVVFFDYLYFIVQSAILAASVIAVLYYKKFNIKCIQYQHMLIIQLLFWPLIMIAILVTSLIFFY